LPNQNKFPYVMKLILKSRTQAIGCMMRLLKVPQVGVEKGLRLHFMIVGNGNCTTRFNNPHTPMIDKQVTQPN
jgi:hypothetical protein